VKSIIIFLIKVYQFTFGMLFPRVCRFAPSCSSYTIEALQVHGVLRGSFLGMWRILRCNPYSHGGWDPVPPKDNTVKDSFKYEKYNKEYTHE